MLQPVADATRVGCSGVADFSKILPSARRSATISGVANNFRMAGRLRRRSSGFLDALFEKLLGYNCLAGASDQ
jgi:hypothetical protein